jgi:tetratricopeptide (TPR) repeat protein
MSIRQVMANASYWLRYLSSLPEGQLLPESDLRGIARALDAAAQIPEAWNATQALALALHPHMERRGYWADWDDFLQILVSQARQREEVEAEARVLTLQGTIRRQRGDYQAATNACRRAWWLCRQAGESSDRVQALSNLGDLYRLQSRFARAETLCCLAIAGFETRLDAIELARAENRLGLTYFDQRRWADARPHLERAEALWRQVGDIYGLAKALHNLGELHRRTGDSDRALAYFEQAVLHYRMAGDEIHIARVQLNIGNIHRQKQDLQKAETIYSQAESILKRAGDPWDLARVYHNLGMVYTGLRSWSEGQACFEREANTWGELSCLYVAWGRRDRTRSCLDKAEQLVQDRPEAHFDSLRRELAQRRARLDGL